MVVRRLLIWGVRGRICFINGNSIDRRLYNLLYCGGGLEKIGRAGLYVCGLFEELREKTFTETRHGKREIRYSYQN